MSAAMTIHHAAIEWARDGARFVDRRYSRAHAWRFDGGAVVPASSSPHVVRPPWSDPRAVDPEEAYVAALASCHMLWFLDLAARAGFTVECYRDAAEGRMASDDDGHEWVAEVMLRPDVIFAGERVPDDAAVDALHHEAHIHCFLARSVRTAIATRGTWHRT